MSIHYIIATYNGKSNRKHCFPKPEQILQCHLHKLANVNHNLSKITISKASSSNHYPNYYQIQDILPKIHSPINIVDVENYGYSMGQWLKAYEQDNQKFDYYFFMEDDYCPNLNDFDKIICDMYNQKFPDKIGMLCSVVEGSVDYMANGGYPPHFGGIVVVSKETMERLYGYERWEGNPRGWLDRLTEPSGLKKLRKAYLGGYYQVSFSHLFNLSGIRLDSYVEENYKKMYLRFPYWDDSKKEISFFRKDGTRTKKCYAEDIFNSPIIPVQLWDNEAINQHLRIRI